MLINLNDAIRVKLTERGHQVHLQWYLRLWHDAPSPPKYNPPEEDEGGFSEFDLWEFMRIFGAALYAGCTKPCEMWVEVLPRVKRPEEAR